MKTLISFFALAVFSFCFNENVTAQDNDTPYVVVEYMKVKPGMWDQYLECEKVWKTIHQYRVKQGLITGWSLEELIYPAGTRTEYDYLVITEYKNWKSMRSGPNWYTAAMATLSPEQQKIAKNANNLRDMVKTEIWSGIDMVFAKEGSHPLYRIENFMKLPAGGYGAWEEMETQFAKPVHEKGIELGIRAGWLAAEMVMPYGDVYPYQVSTIDFFDTWEDINKDQGPAWDAVHPDMDWGKVIKRFNDTRTMVKSEVRMLVDFVE